MPVHEIEALLIRSRVCVDLRPPALLPEPTPVQRANDALPPVWVAVVAGLAVVTGSALWLWTPVLVRGCGV